VIDLAFAGPGDAPLTSPLARALAGAEGIEDLSLLGKLEVRGNPPAGVGGELVPLGPDRTLVICPYGSRADLRRAVAGLVVDVTGSLAGIAIAGEELMRRLTDLDLSALPATGKVAGVRTIVTRDGDRFALFFPQEQGHAFVAAVRDAQDGLR
jgi:hypothetical protein